MQKQTSGYLRNIKAQIQRYDELENDMNFLADFSNRQKVADFAGFIAFNESEEEVFTLENIEEGQ